MHSSTNGHLGYFCFLAIVNNAAMDLDVQISVQSLLSLVLGVCQNWKGWSGIAPFYIPTGKAQVFHFLCILINQPLLFAGFFYNSAPDGCEVEYHCSPDKSGSREPSGHRAPDVSVLGGRVWVLPSLGPLPHLACWAGWIKAAILRTGCILQSLGSFQKSPFPDLSWSQLQQNLEDWGPGLSILRIPLMVPRFGQSETWGYSQASYTCPSIRITWAADLQI